MAGWMPARPSSGEGPIYAICTLQREDLETKEDSKKCQENAEQQREEPGRAGKMCPHACKSPSAQPEGGTLEARKEGHIQERNADRMGRL